MALYYITHTSWINFQQYMSKKFFLYGLIDVDENLTWEQIPFDRVEESIVDRYRANEPIKSFFFPVKEDVANQPVDRKTVLLGVKACDLNHIKTMDSIFLQGLLVDPYYALKRDSTFIISSDCSSCKQSCFCSLMEEDPFPSSGFDMNLSPAGLGFIVETGSQWGEKIVAERKQLFQEPKPQHLEEREKHRNKIKQIAKDNAKEFNWKNPKETVKKQYDSSKWKEDIAKNCVECDACRFICGSCFCFLLSETAEKWGKIRTWDSCQSTGYARVAGGANPKKTKHDRLRNIYMCKFSYRPENFGFYACTGCGRCVDVCQGKIDIRESLKKLSE